MTPQGLAQLQADEGLRLSAYPDPLSGGMPWTIGFGHTGADVYPGLVWTPDRAAGALLNDVAATEAHLTHYLPWWLGLDGSRRDALTNMAYNLGVGSLLGFHHMLAALEAGQWGLASQCALESQWASEVGARARRIAQDFLVG